MVQYEWSYGLPVKTDNDNLEWSYGLPHIIIEATEEAPPEGTVIPTVMQHRISQGMS